MKASKDKHISIMAPTHLAMTELYADALIDQTDSNDDAEQVVFELEQLVDTLQTTGSLAMLLKAGPLTADQRTDLVARIFHGRIGELSEAFLTVLAKRDRWTLLPAIVRRLRRVIDKRQGKIEAIVTTTIELDETQRIEIAKQLRKAFEAEVVLTTQVDANLLGGMTVQVDDRVYDASIAAELQHLGEVISQRISAQGPLSDNETAWP